MFGFLKKAHRARKEEARVGAAPLAPFEPLGLRRTGFVTIDRLPYQVHQGAFLFSPPEDAQRIDARGRVDLGASCELHRFYLTDDAFIQVGTTAKAIDDVKAFIYHDTKSVSTQAGFERWLGEESMIGRGSIDYHGKMFTRVWGDEDQEKIPPVTFDEAVFTDSDSVAEYEVNHFCMLYEREATETGRMEYLLISAEQTGNDYCVVFSVGVDITEADLKIV